MKYVLIGVALLIAGSASAQQQQNVTAEQILQNSVGNCIGENAKLVVALSEARAQVVELQKQLVLEKKEPAPAPSKEQK